MDKKKIGIALLALPMFVSANVSYDQGKNNAHEYINTFNDYKKYILLGEAEKGYGGFLSKEEFDLTYVNNKSYLAYGPQYWLKSDGTKKYIVDYSLKEAESGQLSGVRVTEFVKPETKVKGIGTQTIPWEFVQQYTITAKSSNENYGKIDNNSKLQYVEEDGNVVIHIAPEVGYGYAGTSLDKKLKETITIEDQRTKEITLSDIDSSEDVIVYFLPRNDVQYTVKHHYEGIEDIAEVVESDASKKGTTGTTTAATAITKAGFELDTTKPIVQKEIKGDGTTSLDIYYVRKSYDLALTKGTGISTVSGAKKYKYQQKVKLDATPEVGYGFKQWTENSTQVSVNKTYEFRMPDGNKTYKAEADPLTVKYTVKHHYEGIGSIAEEVVTKEGSGKTGTQTVATENAKTGFQLSSITQKTIAGNGTTVIDAYYTRKSYNLSLNKGEGISSVSGGGTYKYQATVPVSATVASGYTWSKWTGSVSTTNQTLNVTVSDNVTLTATATKNPVPQPAPTPTYNPPAPSGGGGGSTGGGGGSSNTFSLTTPDGRTTYYDSYAAAEAALGKNLAAGTSTIKQNGTTVATGQTTNFMGGQSGSTKVTGAAGTNVENKTIYNNNGVVYKTGS